jgi:3-phenylpropionate/trans-cinnamate dioxygenase ferredoxin subunit
MPDEVTIKVRQNGPYFIHPDDVAKVRLVDHDGNPIAIPGRSITLCRCGASSTKPFCDGTHSKIGFQGAIRAVEEAESADD